MRRAIKAIVGAPVMCGGRETYDIVSLINHSRRGVTGLVSLARAVLKAAGSS